MEPALLAPLIPITAIVAFAVVKIVRIRTPTPSALSGDAEARLESLEAKVEGLQQELAETHERLDFAERLLSQGRDDRRVGG